jgi:glycosyltransferase involved in cell wall biosynthesis
VKVAYLSLLPPPGQPASSGVPKVSETLLRAFEDLPDLHVDAVTLVDGLPQAQTETRGAVTRHYLPCKPHGKTATLYWNEVRRLRRMVEKLRPDVVHGQPSAEYLLAATNCGQPHVITLHGLVERETKGLARLHPATLAGVIRDRLHRRAAARAAHIISISPYVDEWLAGWTRARIWPVPNPIDPEFFTLPPPERSGLRILCVGTVSERKNQALLVRAGERLAAAGVDFECRLVGQPAPGVAERLTAEITARNLAGRVRLTGLVSRAELLGHYAWANVLVLPSREETSPLSLIQGMAAGRIVLGADAAGIPRLLEGGQWGGLFPGEDAGQLAARLQAVGATEWDRAAAAQAHARTTFEPSAVARRTVAVYRATLVTPPAR